MSLSDIFTPSVVISLAISVLLIGLFGLYVNNKLNEQNHKLNTMFDLVSTLANELQMVRSQVPLSMGSPSIGGGGGRVYEKPEVGSTTHLVSMIDVSDDSESSGDESDGETDEGAESDDDGEGEGEEESDDGSEGDAGDDEASDGDSDSDIEDLGHDAPRSDKAIIVSESLDDALFEELANLDEIILEDNKVERVKTPETTTNTSSVKNLNVVFDYKKASLGKLREIVEQKGLSSDTSKLKKQELLKMLEID
jgi:hypothetical protein